MVYMDICIIILEFAVIAILIFGKGYFTKKGENTALEGNYSAIGHDKFSNLK